MDTLPADDGLDDPEAERGAGEHRLNVMVPQDSLTLNVADNARLLYIRRPIVYASAFDTSLLGELIRRHQRGAAAITADLRQQGFTHVLIHWEELARLRGSYGVDPDLSDAQLRSIVGHWTLKWASRPPAIELYELP